GSAAGGVALGSCGMGAGCVSIGRSTLCVVVPSVSEQAARPNRAIAEADAITSFFMLLLQDLARTPVRMGTTDAVSGGMPIRGRRLLHTESPIVTPRARTACSTGLPTRPRRLPTDTGQVIRVKITVGRKARR